MTKRRYDETGASDESSSLLWVMDVGGFVHPSSFGRLLDRRERLASCNIPWSIEDFRIQGVIGQGRFGIVYKAVYNRREQDPEGHTMLRTGQEVALKSFSKANLLDQRHKCRQCFVKLLRREINIHSQ
jgi:serine/threonine protein kinase